MLGKKTGHIFVRRMALIGALLLVGGSGSAGAQPVGTGFTYQGQLDPGGGPATGTYDFEFRLYDGPDPDSATLIETDRKCGVAVTNRLFTVEIDFGEVFDGSVRWLEIGVTLAGGPCDDSTDFTRLSPLQKITAVPYALFALSGNEGPQGEQGSIGPPGLHCWDLNENFVPDFPEEDRNEDGNVDVQDCQGAKGDPGDAMTSPVAARATGSGLFNYSTSGEQRNNYINFESFDVGDNLEVTGGPKFTAPFEGLYSVSYRQVFRNPTNEGLDLPTHWQYAIYLRINGVNSNTYYAIISNINRPADYTTVEMTDILQLDTGNTIEAMELLDPVGGTTLQKAAASFSVALLHCLAPGGCRLSQ